MSPRFPYALIALSVALIPAKARSADDAKAYHGSICSMEREGNDLPTTYGTLIKGSSGAACRYSSTGAACPVVCPLVRDKINDDLSLDGIVMEFYNGQVGSTGSPFACTAYTQQEDISGSTLDSQQLSTTTINTGGVFSWTDLQSTAGNEGSYAVRCDMSHPDDIFHIFVNETTDTGAID